MRRRQAHQAHNGQLWARLYQLIKVEEPITFEAIRRLCSDVPAHDLTTTLREMCAAKRINVARNWRGPSFIETYSYGDGASVNVIDDEGPRLSQPSQQRRQPALFA